MARKIVITSGKGGVGKTTVAVNLGRCLAALGERTVIADTDFGLNNADVVCGAEERVLFGMTDVIEGRCRARQALLPLEDSANLFLLAAGKSYERPLSPQAVRLVLDSLAPRFDYILIDSPAGIEGGFHRACAAADEAIVVTTPHISSLRDADKVVAVLKSYRLKSVELVVNMVRGDMVADGEVLSPNEIAGLLKVPLLGVLPQEDGVFLGERRRSSEGQRAFRMLAANIAKGTRRLYNPTGRYRGFFGSIRRSLKKSL